TVPKVSIERNVSKGDAKRQHNRLFPVDEKSEVDINRLTDISIPCCCSCVPSLQQGHKSKNETRIAQRTTDRSFTDISLILLSQ
ncbi:hypothetical protein, partial [Prevotella pectinovora]|uniref:hypothetical protein n=1 Tax=Prevotella pectinovora TaxID=1602169 RepID=UPI00307B048D